MIIDVHHHIIVPEITRDAAPEEDWRPRVFWEDGKQVVDFRGRRLHSALRPYVEIEAILEAQREAGVEGVLLSPWSSLLGHDRPSQEGRRICQIQNQSLAGLTEKYPEQVRVLGTVPMQDIPHAIEELQHLMRDGRFEGIEIAATVGELYVGDDSFRPFWDAVEQAEALVFIHPTTRGLGISALQDYYMNNTVGNPLETAIVAAQLVMSGVIEQHPNLRILLSHGGGAVLSLRGRLRHAHSFQPKARSRLKESPIDSLKRFYFDTVTHDADLLRQLIDFAGEDHVLLGSDYPYDMGYERPVDLVRSLALSADSEAKVLGGNAARLMRTR